jgi:hypothetical protein
MTTTVLAVSAAVVAVVAAARSTWSPCGVSMLATITPLAETGRGHRYRSTALWFVAGAVVGGLTLGLVLGVVAIGIGAAAPSLAVRAALACVAAVVCAASDARIGRVAIPVHHRQVNERWLDQFRAWVYGAGFGWQIGTGFVTYIKTAGVYLMAFLAVLTGSWWIALALGVLFGLVRGIAVFLGRSITSPVTLAAFHRRFTRLGPVVLVVVVCVESAAAVLFGWLLSPWAGVAVALAGATSLLTRMAHRRSRAGTVEAVGSAVPVETGVRMETVPAADQSPVTDLMAEYT